jgi:hypothetical protein
MKSFFRKLLLSIPLRPNIAAVFAIILGILGFSLPSVYLFIRVQDSLDTVTFLTVSWLDLTTVIDLWTCSSYLTRVELPPGWLIAPPWYAILRGFPIFVGMLYFNFFGSKKSKNVVFALVMLCIVSSLGISILFAPEKIECSDGWNVNIYAYSISWFSFFVPAISLLLGIFAYQRGKINTKIERPA